MSVGSGGGIAVDRPLIKLVADPARCVLYGLASDAVLVFDTRLKMQVATVALPAAASDLDVAGDGSRAVVGHSTVHQLTLLDLDQRTVAATVATTVDTARVEITRDGIVFYVDVDQFSEIHRVELATNTDTKLQDLVHYKADIELADDDVRLFVADSSLSYSALTLYDTTDGVFGLMDHHTGRFNTSARHLFVSKQTRAYYAEHQWTMPNDLRFVAGGTGEPIYAEDDAGQIAIGKQHVWDAALLRRIGTHPSEIAAAAFAAAGQEVWTYSPTDSLVRYVATSELTEGQALGIREVPPEPLGDYAIEQLVHDPSRPVLYARDSSHNVVVAIDSATLQPMREIRVGSEPSDLAIDPDGSALYVAHAETTALATISLESFTFGGFIPTVEIPYEVEPVSSGRVVFNTEFGPTTPTLFDVQTRVAYPLSSSHYNAAIAVAGDTLFVGESGTSSCNLFSYAISGTALTRTGQTNYNTGVGFNAPPRIVAASRSGSTVFYAGHAFDGADLSMIRYSPGQHVLLVSPDGRVGLSSTNVFDVSNGANLGLLPVESTVQAIDPTSHTAYLLHGATIETVNLDSYVP